MAELLALSRAEQERAKHLLARRLYLHLGTLGLGLLAVFVDSPWVYIAGGLALVTEAAAWWMRTLGLEAHEAAEAGRRRAVLTRELGYDPDRLNTATLNAEFSSWARAHAAEWDDPAYYATTGPVGPARLCEAQREASFWSARLYRAAGRNRCLLLAGIASAIVVLTLLIMVVDAGTPGALAARAATVALATLVAVDELSVCTGFYAAARVSDRTAQALTTINPQDIGQVLSTFSDYAVATALAPPIPTRIYLREKDQLEAAWTAQLADNAP